MTTTDVIRFPARPADGTLNQVTITLDDLFGTTAACDCTGSPLDNAITAGYVRRQVHPTLPLAILNYAEKTAYERVWTPITRTCRGLIYNTDTGEVVARPFPKFWNTTEPETGSLDLTEKAVVFDKADGSLAVVYRTPDGPAIATRGSFASEQAIHATQVLRTRYAGWAPPDGLTVLAEIIYPENRIVVDYADMDDLVLLGAVDIATGRSFGPEVVPDWPGPVVEQFPYATLGVALAAPVRDNAEGFVIWFPERDVRTKAKYEEYVRLHRVVTNLTARKIHEHMLTGAPISDFIAPLPDEFHAWCKETAEGIEAAVNKELWRLEDAYAAVRDVMPDGWRHDDRAGRAAFAMVAAQHPDKWALFRLLDGGNVRPELLKRAEPGPFITPTGRTYTEENA